MVGNPHYQPTEELICFSDMVAAEFSMSMQRKLYDPVRNMNSRKSTDFLMSSCWSMTNKQTIHRFFGKTAY